MPRLRRAALPLSRTPLLAAIVVAVVLSAVSCVESDDPEEPTPTASLAGEETETPSVTATAAGPLAVSAFPALVRDMVCWYDDPSLASTCLPPDADALAAIEELRRGGLQMAPFLIDLLSVDVGWRPQVEAALERLTGERFEDIRDWYEWEADEWRGSLPEGYDEWKARLLSFAAPPEGAPTFDDLIGPNTASRQPNMLVWTGTQPGGVPALDNPPTVHRIEELYLAPSDVVFGVVEGGEARAYPRRILAWHGVVNDSVGGVPIVVTYCITCGGGGAFDRRVAGITHTFRDAGLAFGVDTLMYDEERLDLWSMSEGAPLPSAELPDGTLATGEALEPILLMTTTWGEWSARYPDTRVLDLATGFARDYDAGAAIAEQVGDERPLYGAAFGLMGPEDHGIATKEQVLAVTVGEATRIYPVAAIEARGVVHDELGGAGIVLLSRGAGTGVSVYQSAGTTFSRLEGSGTELRAVDTMGERWFVAWRELIATLDGRARGAVPTRQGYWWGGPAELDVWSP